MLVSSGIRGLVWAAVSVWLRASARLLPNQLPGLTRESRQPLHPASVSDRTTRPATVFRIGTPLLLSFRLPYHNRVEKVQARSGPSHLARLPEYQSSRSI